MPAPESRRFDWKTNDGWPMTGEIWVGSRNRLPVLIVHGLGEHAGRYQPFARDLMERGHTVIVPDLRGHGRSHGSRGHTPSFQHLVDDLHVLQRQLREQSLLLQSPLLIGHSMGGAIATVYAFQQAEQLAGLYLISPFFREAFLPQWWRLMAGHVFYYLYPALALNVGLNLENLADDKAVQKSIVDDDLTHQKLSARWAMEARSIASQLPYARQWLTIPTAIVHGDQDRITHAEASRFLANHQNQMRLEAGECPLIQFHSIADGRHQIHNDSHTRNEVLEALDRLIQRIHHGECTE